MAVKSTSLQKNEKFMLKVAKPTVVETVVGKLGEKTAEIIANESPRGTFRAV